MYIGRALPLLLLSSALLASASSASSASAPYDVCSNVTSAMSMASGGLSLSHPSEGSYQDCHAIPTAQYCLFTTALNVSGHAIPVTNGRCVPRQCTSSLLEGYVRGKLNVTENGVQGFLDQFGPALAKYLNVTQGDLQRNLDVLEASANFAAVSAKASCDSDVKAMGAQGKTVVGFIVLLALLAVISTAMEDLGKRGMLRCGRHSAWTIFSVTHNLQRLAAPMLGDFQALNGMRVLSMGWVITGHTVLTSATIPSAFSLSAITTVVTQTSFMLIESAVFAVDTFFFLSGFLGAHALIKQQPNMRRGMADVTMAFKMYLMRWLRLTPAYGMALATLIFVIPHLGDGPYWPQFQTAETMGTSVCYRNWWTNILYINNLVPWDNNTATNGAECMGWTWYLANDFQMFLFLPWLTLLLHVSAATGITVCSSIILMQLILTGTTSHYDTINGGDAGADIYNKPWNRCSPYIVGILAAWLYHARIRWAKKAAMGGAADEEQGYRPLRDLGGEAPAGDGKGGKGGKGASVNSLSLGKANQEGENSWRRIHWAVRMAVYTLCIAATAVIVFVPATDASGHPGKGLLPGVQGNWSPAGRAVYDSVGYLCWSLALAGLTHCWFCGHGSAISWFLSHPVWTPLARLTYNAYLVHLMIMLVLRYSIYRLDTYNAWYMMLDAVGYITIAYGIALILYLLAEKPAMNMLSFALKGFGKGGGKGGSSEASRNALNGTRDGTGSEAGSGPSRPGRQSLEDAARIEAELDSGPRDTQ